MSRESVSYLNEKNNQGPNENRFIAFNTKPEILSTVRRIGKVDITKYSSRRENK